MTPTFVVHLNDNVTFGIPLTWVSDAENEFFAVADDVKANDTFQWSEVDDVGVSTINQADLERADNRFSLVFEMAKVAGGLTRATKNVIYVCALEISDGDMKSIWPDSQYLFYVGQGSSGIFDRWVGDASSHLRAAACAGKCCAFRYRARTLA